MNKIKKILNLIRSTVYKIFKKPLDVFNSEQTIDFILKNNISIGRFGDGELSIINGGSLKFQEYNGDLSEKLKAIKTNENFLVCMPCIFNKSVFNKKILTNNEYKFWNRYNLTNYYCWYKQFYNNIYIGDSFISRFYMRYKDKEYSKMLVQKLKKIWEDKDIVFIEGERSRLGVGNDLFNNAKTIKRILCPSINAFKEYDNIINFTTLNISKTSLIIIALGPTATVLAYDLSQLGYQALDLGHIDIEYEWFKSKAKEKVDLTNKYVNEVNGGEITCDCADEEYSKQIICKIGI